MMEIASSCPFPVTSVTWQGASGAWALTLVCKATFRLEVQDATPADPQEPINDEDNHWNDDPARSLVAPTDLVPYKPRADVLVVGHAYAPEGRPARSVTASVAVGQVSKAIEVHCDRWFDLDGRVHEGGPFVRMPLRYERAAGGGDSDNPVGMRFDAEPDAYGRVMIPNLQPLGAHIGWRGDRFDPVGFGPIAPHWPARRGQLHRHALGFSQRDWSRRPLPDIDFGYFNAAPRDQQSDFIRPDERILLENLHRGHARLLTRLPGTRPVATVERARSGREEMRLQADTLWIDTDRAVCTVVWRGGIGLHHPRDAGTIHVTVEVPGRAGTSAMAQAPPVRVTWREEPPASAPADATMTLAAGLEPSSDATLPFVQSAWAVSPYARSQGSAQPSEDAGQTMFLLPGAAEKAAVPFPLPEEPGHEQWIAPERVTAPVEPAAVPGPAAPGPTGQVSLGEARPLVAPASPGARSGAAQGVGEIDAAAGEIPAVRPGEEETRAGLPVGGKLPEPPPMIGPLARPEMESAAPSADGSPVKPPFEVIPRPTPAPVNPDLCEYDIEHCAQIAVSIACRPVDTARILEEHGLSGADWGYVKNHWLAEIKRELGRGQNTLLRRYDIAYVMQVEAERGPIGIEEYARLTVAAERGRLEDAVEDLGLPPGAPIRLERVMVERAAKDVAFGNRVRAAVEEWRER